MSLISLVIVLAVVGFVVWLVNTYVPMGAQMKTVINVVVLVVVVFWLLRVFGLLSSLHAIHV